MVYRRNRHRYHRRHIRLRRLYRKHLRRTRCRTRCGGRTLTVDYHHDYVITRSSPVPRSRLVTISDTEMCTAVGVPKGSFHREYINPLPTILLTELGGSFSSFSATVSIQNIVTSTAASPYSICMDLPKRV